MAACRVLDEPIRLTVLDGQMGVEDVWDDGTDTHVTRYGIGALLPLSANASCRGEGAGGWGRAGFPLYDTHGNLLATLGRQGCPGLATTLVTDTRPQQAKSQTGIPSG